MVEADEVRPLSGGRDRKEGGWLAWRLRRVGGAQRSKNQRGGEQWRAAARRGFLPRRPGAALVAGREGHAGRVCVGRASRGG